MMKYIIAVCCLLFIYASVGPQSFPTGNFYSDASAGTVAWNIPSRGSTSNNSYTTASLTIGNSSEYLCAVGADFSSVSGTVNGIVVEIEKKSNGVNSIKDNIVRLIIGGVISGENKASASYWGTSDAYTTYGSATDTWQLSLTVADVQDANFGIAMQCFTDYLDGAIASVDHYRMTVYYTTASGAKRYVVQ